MMNTEKPSKDTNDARKVYSEEHYENGWSRPSVWSLKKVLLMEITDVQLAARYI